ncbi:hypothetical protein LARI1_G009627 [Lachnellula arida]|uniref:Zn(2)-C6 fungal-type domain-containing protein n=1 Tax=Lachnellula arida TaxID=1316785 RepID=A0A8T9AYM1_9HELO|nr:hypothetical protein LARI1_G009627 [Lachnellula arida]
MPCSNCNRYHRRCVVLNGKSQRCGECVRRGAKCDALQASIDDLQDLRLEEERLKFERDTAFEAAMAGLARVRELELRQQELRERGVEMVRRHVESLDESDEAEEKEKEEREEEKRKEKEQAKQGALQATFFDGAGSSENPLGSDFFLDPADPALAAALSAYDPSDPYWQGVGSGTPQTSQGS